MWDSIVPFLFGVPLGDGPGEGVVTLSLPLRPFPLYIYEIISDKAIFPVILNKNEWYKK